MEIKFNETFTYREQISYIEDALIKKEDYIKKVSSYFEGKFNTKNFLLTNSASNAMELILQSLDLSKGDEVILPSFTYPSTAGSLVRLGLKPVFADIRKDVPVIDIYDAMGKTTERTRCIIPSHYGGAACDMELLMDFAAINSIYVIEDGALSYDVEYKGRYLSTIGDAGIISFGETKNISAESGGILFYKEKLTDEIKRKIRINYDNGTDRADFIEGKVKWYSWQEPGLSVKMPNVNAALLYSQLMKEKEIWSIRKCVYDCYMKELKSIGKWTLPETEAENKENYHVFYMIFNCNSERERVRNHLSTRNIHAHTHYMPLHASSMGMKLGYKYGDLKNTEHISECLLRLPLHNNMTIKDAEYVIESIRDCL